MLGGLGALRRVNSTASDLSDFLNEQDEDEDLYNAKYRVSLKEIRLIFFKIRII
jgi:hypothetical protein